MKTAQLHISHLSVLRNLVGFKILTKKEASNYRGSKAYLDHLEHRAYKVVVSPILCI